MILMILWLSLLFGLFDSNTVVFSRDFWFLIPIALGLLIRMKPEEE